jgi:hypothetical protein
MILVAGLAAAAGLAAWPGLELWGRRAVVVTALMTALAGPVAYTLDTVTTPHAGAIPSAGPAVTAASGFGPNRPGGPAAAGGFGGAGRVPGAPGGGVGGSLGGANSTGGVAGRPGAGFGGALPNGAGNAGGGAPAGGLLNASAPSATLVTYLEGGAAGYRWVVATVGANEAAGYQLATGDAILAIGGFNGSDPAPTLVEFEQLVETGKIHYFIGGAGGAGGSSAANQITSWVESHFPSTAVAGVTLYNLASRSG